MKVPGVEEKIIQQHRAKGISWNMSVGDTGLQESHLLQKLLKWNQQRGCWWPRVLEPGEARAAGGTQ